VGINISARLMMHVLLATLSITGVHTGVKELVGLRVCLVDSIECVHFYLSWL
jgi:hypothetical protein